MPTHPHPDAERALAQVGYNVLETIGRAFGTFAFGINPVALGAGIGTVLGSSGGRRDGWPSVHQN